MMRFITLHFMLPVAAASLAVMLASSASAQTTPGSAPAQDCSFSLHSVYYARGEATPSGEAVTLISHIGTQAAACEPDGVDLVTAIDTAGEHDAVQLALARLGNVASELVASGVPANRIRLAARPAGAFASPMGEVAIIFRKALPGPDDAAAPVRPVQPQTLPDTI